MLSGGIEGLFAGAGWASASEVLTARAIQSGAIKR